MNLNRGIQGFGRLPGPLGVLTTFMAGFSTSPTPSKPTVKIFEPDPTSGWESDLSMQDLAGKPIVVFPVSIGEVRQGRTGNCPVVATLAALAHAAPDRIMPMISTRAVNVVAQVIDTSNPTPTHLTIKEETILYKVRFAKGNPVEVSGLLWTRRGSPEYAMSTNDEAVWTSILEKAYVVEHGGNSYQTIFATVTPHEAMTNILGPVNEIVLKKSSKGLTVMLNRAGRRPTIADTFTNPPVGQAFPPGIIGFHTYAVQGLINGKVTVYNVLNGVSTSVPVATFKKVFETVVQAKL